MTAQNTALPQPISLGDGLTPVDIWQSLHASERSWIAKAGGAPRFVFNENADSSDRMLLEMLPALPVRRWFDLCNGAGWTVLGGAALSWCKEGSLGDVLHVFRELKLMPEPGNAWERAASLINPAALPENRLSALMAFGKDEIGVCVLIAARQERPALDVPSEQVAALLPSIRALIESRIAAF
ncbi:hypothetical protein [Phyllobacterium leguminum]|uniref:Uncharacterized protein n=1 Tax=Phyllobacterium leguminum TaxID=314237 RepID=A0A318SUK9_9HYPH|nr:hypothetical protein [Phyllobacterium leguminum]PYE85162.1 hypothetical protein C7477_1396 [Phyllobacterium leguminum]